MASTPKQALSGIRVIDMSRLLPGPMASQFLADLGAEVRFVFPNWQRNCMFSNLKFEQVIKVEDTDGGDYARYYPPSLPDGNSSLFHALNRGKKSVLLNLKKKEDRAQLNALLATADILLETFRPGVMAKLGFSPAELQQRFGKLIICSITGYGQTGPAGTNFAS
jgi:crotonobetainyl-CoA:carnitine CoA-transferase CaiB-like acyl-CoA transferase